MFAFVAWFARGPVSSRADQERRDRARRHLAGRVPAAWCEACYSGPGWGAIVRHADLTGWRWALAANDDELRVISAGLAVGVEASSPLGLGRRLLRGEDVHRGAAPPFALLAVDDRAGRLAIQQDWYGMGQVFCYEGSDAVGFASRPSLLPAVFGEPIIADRRGWSYYLGNSAFAASSAPVARVRLLDPGERVDGTRDARGRWELRHQTRWGFDDLVADALSDQVSFDDLTAGVAEGVRRAAHSLTGYWPHQVSVGLSGGRDSRLIAAALVSAGTVPRFSTNDKNPVEGETARRLTAILREQLHLDVNHRFYVATKRDLVLAASVADRARILQRHNDFMFPSTYLNRPAEREPPATFGTPSLTGAMGECIRDVWLPPEWLKDPSSATRAEAHDVLERKLTQTVPANALTSPARAELAGLVAGIRQRSVELDLDAFQTVTYGYLLGRMRRLNTATTHPEQVMPLAIPEVFRAAFRLAPQDKGRVHQAVIAQLVPEWGEIPFVTYRTGVQPASILRIWHGPGAAELDGLLQRGPGPVSSLLEPDAVRAALGRVGGRKGGNPEDAILRQFAFAAVADEAFEPDLPPVSLAHATTSRARRVVAGSPLATPARRVLRAARRFESARRRRG